ncbi:pTP [Amniota adenovirus 1]|nr:pTP [Amniota adenovirus 1]
MSQWSRDSGQNPSTLRYYRPVINISRLDRKTYPTINQRVLYFVSKKLQYTKTQLISFDPDNPQLRKQPLYGHPPPNLLLGYKPLIDIISGRPFDSTTITQFTYHPIKSLGVLDRMEWSILTSGDINTDVTEYGNLVDIESWENRADEIDVQTIRETRTRLLLNRLVNSERNMIGTGHQHTDDIKNCKLINDVRIAAFNYAMLSAANRPVPTIEDELDENHQWIHRLIKSFSSTRWQEWIPPDTANPIDAISIAAIAMTLGHGEQSNVSSLWEMTGGAMRLRSGRLIGSPYNLRGPRRYPIYTSGRQRDSATRRRIARQYVNQRLNIAQPTEEEQEPENDQIEINDEQNFHMEIMRLLEEIARQSSSLQSSTSSRFMSFHNKFYDSMRSHIAESISFNQEPNPSFIKAWLINYLISEQISQIFSLLSSKLTNQSYPKPTFTQIVLLARDRNDQNLFKRIWSTTQRPYDMFFSLYKRIIEDMINSLTLILNQPDIPQIREEAEAMLLEFGLSDVSGDISNVLEQATSYEQIENITISIKLKCRGLVAFSVNPTIVNAFKRWMGLQVQDYKGSKATARKPQNPT